MWVWGKSSIQLAEGTSVARAASEGKSRQELVTIAARALLSMAEADRVGVWIAAINDWSPHAGQVVTFRGIVADKNGEATPAEWSRLSPGPPLPVELLSRLQTVQQDLTDVRNSTVIGALLEMRRALWVPVKVHGELRGVLLATTRKQVQLSRTLPESVAAELALAMELEEERHLGRQRQQDSRRVLATLNGSEPVNEILNAIARDCTDQQANGDGQTAIFAAIGQTSSTVDFRNGSSARGFQVPQFTWSSGAAAWVHMLESEPVAAIWRRALETHTVAGTEVDSAVAREVLRVVAFPLQAAGENLGVLVVGLRQGNLAIVERLQLQAALAGTALAGQKQAVEVMAQKSRFRSLLTATGTATIVLQSNGRIAEASDLASTLLAAAPKSAAHKRSEPSQLEDFCALVSIGHVGAVQEWLECAFGSARGAQKPNDIFPSADLRNGGRVRLQVLQRRTDESLELLLQRLPESIEAAAPKHAITEIVNVIEWLEEGIVLFGADQQIRAVNSRFGHIVGLSPQELGSMQTLDDLVVVLGSRSADAGSFGESWQGLNRSSETAVREEVHLIRPVPRLLERAGRPIFDEKGVFIGRVEIYRDLTAQRVFQSKLVQTEKLAELGQMVTGIAHELSNPLTSILGYAQRLLTRHDAGGKSHEARQIFQEAERADAILRQLLLSARESRPERRRVALNQVVSRSLELQRFNLAADNMHLQLNLDPVLPFVQGDAGQLQQVLVNLIDNARHAIEEQGRGGTIRVKTQRIGEKRVLLEVSDDGPGIPQELQSRIFDPFFTTKPAGVGTGLGLAIVVGIVREHGGRLHLTSNPGHGAVFSIELPAMATAEQALPATGGIPVPVAVPRARSRSKSLPESEPLEIAHAGPVLARWSGERVLVLEDEPTVARLIADVLEDEGLRVDVSLNARDALERAAQTEYALAVCDMKMPGLDGEHFYQALATANNSLRERFLFVTGDVLAAHTRNFLERNRLPHVAKPFRVEELTQKVRTVLEANSPRKILVASGAKKNAAST